MAGFLHKVMEHTMSELLAVEWTETNHDPAHHSSCHCGCHGLLTKRGYLHSLHDIAGKTLAMIIVDNKIIKVYPGHNGYGSNNASELTILNQLPSLSQIENKPQNLLPSFTEQSPRQRWEEIAAGNST